MPLEHSHTFARDFSMYIMYTGGGGGFVMAVWITLVVPKSTLLRAVLILESKNEVCQSQVRTVNGLWQLFQAVFDQELLDMQTDMA